jgi:myo-inositol-1(or 4)-monophosphatase
LSFLTPKGTTNFIHGIPDVCVSIGFAVGGRPAVGVILNPFTCHLYTGILGQGSWRTILDLELSQEMKREKLPLYRRPLKLDTSILAISYPSRTEAKIDSFLAKLKRLLSPDGGMIRGTRKCGSCAIEICEVACGYLDGKLTNNQAWDVCAGWVIVIEAGGYITSGTPPTTGETRVEAATDVFSRNFLFVRATRNMNETVEFVKAFWRVTKTCSY